MLPTLNQDPRLTPGVAVEGEAEAWPVWDGEPAVLRLRRVGEQRLADRHHAQVPFDDPAVHHAGQQVHVERSEERRVGKEGDSSCRSGWSQYPSQKKNKAEKVDSKTYN